EGKAKLEDPGNYIPIGVSPVVPSGVTGEIKFKDDGTSLLITGKAKGLTPDVLYISLIYDIGSSAVGGEACEPTIFGGPDSILPTMFVGFWFVDEDGEGKLLARNIFDDDNPGTTTYVPLSKIGTISIRDSRVIGPFGPGSGPSAVVACGVVEVEDDEEEEDEEAGEADFNDRFAVETTGARGEVEWDAEQEGSFIVIDEIEVEGLMANHPYEIWVTVDFDPSLTATFGPFFSDEDGDLEIEELEVSVPGPGSYRLDVFLTHTHDTGDTSAVLLGLVGAIEPFTIRDILLACDPPVFVTLEADD
ncbi:MAG: hypothetical protein V3R48_06380, partial [Thermoplasmata archaeon]